MTANSMSCELFNDQLMAYLERETDDATSAAVERHSVTCAECGALLADLRTLRIDAANLPEMQPSRDLWSGIAARIEAPVVSIGARQAGASAASAARFGWTRRWTRHASIAAGLVLAASLGYFARGTTVEPVTGVAVTPDSPIPAEIAVPAESREPRAESQVAESQVVESRVTDNVARVDAPAVVTQVARSIEEQNAAKVVATLAADYDREIARLQLLIDQRRNQLDPVTVAVIEKNLKVIDTAIAECKKAIASDPASGFLIESLNQSLRSKVELMRTAALLPSRT